MVNVRTGCGGWTSGGHGDLSFVGLMVDCSEGSEEFGSPFIFLKEFQGVSKIGLILP